MTDLTPGEKKAMQTNVSRDEADRIFSGGGKGAGSVMACRLARAVIALHQQLADAQAAVALVVERAGLAVANVEIGFHDGLSGDWLPLDGPSIISASCDAIRALADTDGMALLAELRAERDKWRGIASDNGRGAMDNLAAITALEADRDRLAAANAALEEKVRGLVEAISPLGDMAMWTESADDGEAVILTVGTVRKIRTILAAMQPAEGEQG